MFLPLPKPSSLVPRLSTFIVQRRSCASATPNASKAALAPRPALCSPQRSTGTYPMEARCVLALKAESTPPAVVPPDTLPVRVQRISRGQRTPSRASGMYVRLRFGGAIPCIPAFQRSRRQCRSGTSWHSGTLALLLATAPQPSGSGSSAFLLLQLAILPSAQCPRVGTEFRGPLEGLLTRARVADASCRRPPAIVSVSQPLSTERLSDCAMRPSRVIFAGRLGYVGLVHKYLRSIPSRSGRPIVLIVCAFGGHM